MNQKTQQTTQQQLGASQTPPADMQAETSKQSEKSEYFNLVTTGVGEIRRIREIEVKRAKETFWAADLRVFDGPKDKPYESRYSLRIMKSTLDVAKQLKEASNDDKRKVVIGFSVSDGAAENYTYTEQKSGASRLGNVIRARLLKVTFATIDGELVHGELPEESGDRYETVTTGVGYLNFIGQSKDKDGNKTDKEEALINCLAGPRDDPSKINMCSLVLPEAEEAIGKLKDALKGKMSVFAGFRFTGGFAQSISRKSKSGDEEVTSRIRNRLKEILWASVDGDRVIESKPSPEAQPQQ